jgi:ribosomal 50S subunit-recycling heat shock protein
VRLDMFLSVSRLLKRRTEAKRACELGLVSVNGQKAKASTPVVQGDVLELDLPRTAIRAEVVSVPRHRLSRADARELVRVVDRTAKREDLFEA